MKTNITITVLALLLSTITSLASAAESTPENTGTTPGHKDLSYAMQKTMDPNVWMKLMNSMMSGELQGQPAIASCVECHTNEDIARYQKDFGPAMHSMNPMRQMASPQGFSGAAGSMMGMMNPMTGMITPMMGMMNPMTGMMTPMMGMMNPMTGMMMAPMTGMMPGMGGMTNPMGMMMNPMTGMMTPMMGMQGMPGMGMMPQMPGMQGMPPMGMMPQMPGMTNPGAVPPIGGMSGPQAIMDPKQYEKFYQQWQEMMSKMGQTNPNETETQ